MRIKVITIRTYQELTDNVIGDLMVGQELLGLYYATQDKPFEVRPRVPEKHEFMFNWDGKTVKIIGSSWSKPCDNLENCFSAIRSYFYGTGYKIVDLLQMR